MYKNTILLQYFIVNRLHGGMFMNLNNITKINKNFKKREKKKEEKFRGLAINNGKTSGQRK